MFSVRPASDSMNAKTPSGAHGLSRTSFSADNPATATKLDGPTTMPADRDCAPQSGQSMQIGTLYHSFVSTDRWLVREKPVLLMEGLANAGADQAPAAPQQTRNVAHNA